MKWKKIIEEFVKTKIDEDVVYNEFSLQHELGIFFREKLKKEHFKVEFERNVKFFSKNQNKDLFNKFVKKEMDIVVYKDFNENSEKFAIELKFPTNGAYPRRMFQCIEDIKFMEQVKDKLGFANTYCLTLTSDLLKGKPFRCSNRDNGGKVYDYFRNDKIVHGKIINPFKVDEAHDVKGCYSINWQQIGNTNFWYYLLEI